MIINLLNVEVQFSETLPALSYTQEDNLSGLCWWGPGAVPGNTDYTTVTQRFWCQENSDTRMSDASQLFTWRREPGQSKSEIYLPMDCSLFHHTWPLSFLKNSGNIPICHTRVNECSLASDSLILIVYHISVYWKCIVYSISVCW